MKVKIRWTYEQTTDGFSWEINVVRREETINEASTRVQETNAIYPQIITYRLLLKITILFYVKSRRIKIIIIYVRTLNRDPWRFVVRNKCSIKRGANHYRVVHVHFLLNWISKRELRLKCILIADIVATSLFNQNLSSYHL